MTTAVRCLKTGPQTHGRLGKPSERNKNQLRWSGTNLQQPRRQKWRTVNHFRAFVTTNVTAKIGFADNKLIGQLISLTKVAMMISTVEIFTIELSDGFTQFFWWLLFCIAVNLVFQHYLQFVFSLLDWKGVVGLVFYNSNRCWMWYHKYIYWIAMFSWLNFRPFRRLERPFWCNGRPFCREKVLDTMSQFRSYGRIADTFLSAAQFSRWGLEQNCGA